MKKKVYFLSIILTTFFLFLFHNVIPNDIPKGTLIVKVENIKRPNGNICLLLFNQPDGYPKDRNKALMSDFRPVNGRNTVTFELGHLNYGNYAVAILHDENNNQRMDYNMLGIPKEGFGFFNVSGTIMRVPTFEETSITLREPRKEAKVIMMY